ncbi:maltose O-acetyltransferase [Friedmanniella luteola]|uniref:Maltose O-acetyltransferase n=1 Tax=Friedmanniella luteola TaxID=546871 RepID=A0A1H1YE30_9ACTN|nr:acyltransferase [Friedmanniella luteola]SDT19529.1 maltose O-acetyltransferase [Friedmanniella luteola]
MADRLAELAGHLRQDARIAGSHLLLTVLGGSIYLPPTVRKLIYRRAGAPVESPPGFGFRFAGRPANLRVGPDVYFNQRVFIEAVGPVVIGSGCAFGMEVMVVTSHHELGTDGRWSIEATGRGVTIGDRVWVGARAMILPGAVVEDDVVIAAGAVVTGRCRSGGVYAGVPARRIRELVPAQAPPRA